MVVNSWDPLQRSNITDMCIFVHAVYVSRFNKKLWKLVRKSMKLLQTNCMRKISMKSRAQLITSRRWLLVRFFFVGDSDAISDGERSWSVAPIFATNCVVFIGQHAAQLITDSKPIFNTHDEYCRARIFNLEYCQVWQIYSTNYKLYETLWNSA